MTNEIGLTQERGSYAVSFSNGECKRILIRPSQINAFIRAGYFVEIYPRLHPEIIASAKNIASERNLESELLDD